MQGTSWHSPGSAEQPTHLVTRALNPFPGRDATDFGFIPDPRIFCVEVSGAMENVPVRLLSRTLADEALCCP